MKNMLLILGFVLLTWSVKVNAEDEEYSGPYDNAPAYQNNTGPLVEGDTTAEIISPDENGGEDAAGVVKGEITLNKTDADMRVFSGFSLVERITNNSDGWIGRIEQDGTSYMLSLTGRPKLVCPAQQIANWFGPCKVPENNG